MAYDVTLSAASRQNLLSLQNTAALASTNQTRLSTGKAVNSALDNPVNYFTASALTTRASALTSLLDGISNGIQTIQAASKGIDSITSLVKSMQSTVKQAQTDAATNRPKIAGNLALATAGEVEETGKSKQDIVYGKKLIDSDANAANNTATKTASGNLGIENQAVTAVAGDPDAATPVDEVAGVTNTIRLSAGNTVYSFDFDTTTTVRDMVSSINKSGIATASVGSDGKLTVTGTGSDALTFEVGATTAATADAPASFEASNDATAALLQSTESGAETIDYADVTATGSSAVRSNLVQQFNDLRSQLDKIATDSGFNGINLLGGDKLSITFNEKTGNSQNKLDIQGSELSSTSLGIGQFIDSSETAEGGDFSVQNDTDLAKAADSLTNALVSLNSLSSTFGSNLSTVQTRQDFTKNIADVLSTGASNLTNADMNEEAAKSNALSTRQSLAISALSLANQASQGVLQLLR